MFFCGVLDGRIVSQQGAFDEIANPINDSAEFDLPIPPKHVMFDIFRAPKLWNAPGRNALMYCVFLRFSHGVCYLL